MTLGPGQILHGTGWNVKGISELCHCRHFEPPPWMLACLEHSIRDTEKHQGCLMTGNETLEVPRLPRVILETRDIRRLKWAWNAPLHTGEVMRQDCNGQRYWRDPIMSWETLFQESNIWPNFNEFRRPGLAISFSFASAIYGALHALAWSEASLPKAETVLWRVAVCVLISVLPLLLFWYCSTYPRYGSDNQGVRATLFREITSKPILRSMLFICILARVYLVVECFVNLFHLPSAVFQTPDWSVYFPHIS